MKRNVLFVSFMIFALTVLSEIELKAQRSVEFSGWGGYMLSGRVNFYEGDFVMHDNTTFGGSVGFEVSNNTYTFFSYSNTSTTAEFIPYVPGYLRWQGDIGINYVQIGSLHDFPVGRFVPFFGGSLGAAIMNVKQSTISDVWRFSMALNGGFKVFLTDAVALKFQARMLMPMYFAGMGFYLGMGTGGTSTGLSMDGGVLALQGDFTGGLVFKINQ